MRPPSREGLRRIAVIGSSCSGKSTLSRHLAAQLDAPYVELDDLYWLPDWQWRGPDEFRAVVADAASGDDWIIAGNYSQVRDVIWPRATSIVWLDYPFPLVFSRALARTIRRSITREKLFAGNTESLYRAFCTHDSLLLWIITTFRSSRRRYSRLMCDPTYANAIFYRLRRPSAALEFVELVSAVLGEKRDERTT